MVAMVMRIASLMTTLPPSPPLQLVSGYFNLLSLPTIYWCPYFFILQLPTSKIKLSLLEVSMCSLIIEVSFTEVSIRFIFIMKVSMLPSQ